MDCLQQFYPLLAESVDRDEIGLCQWIDTGRTVDTAMPELYELIGRRRQWKAVYVCTELDDPNGPYPADPFNPYDFAENRDRDGLTIEDGRLVDCEAPLIRLTHMLGGMPSPEPKFVSTVVESAGRVPRMEYHPVTDEETAARKRAYDEWVEANAFHGPPPTEIILVKLRSAAAAWDTLSRVSSSWQVHTEADSSEFWKRNLYPHNCRFLVFDMEKRGAMRQQSDLFRFWLSVLLISRNDVDPNVLQAHRLYSLDLSLNDAALRETFQQTVNRLNVARYRLEKSIAQDEAQRAGTDAPIPDYSVSVPISFQLPRVSDMHFDPGDYGLTGGEGSADLTVWDAYSRAARRELETLLRSADRTLDKASERVRESCRYDASEVTPLTQYQEEDMVDSLAEVYQTMLEQQEALPAALRDVEDDIDAADADFRAGAIERVTGGQAAFALGVPIGLAALCVLPGLFLGGSYLRVGASMAGAALLLALTLLIVLRVQRTKLLRLAERFQAVFQAVVSQLSFNASAFSDFLGSVASHMRGRSYLNEMRLIRVKRDSSYYFKQKHVKAIDLFLAKLSFWSAALHVGIDPHSVDILDRIDDYDGEIDYDSLYTFEQGKTYAVPLNRIGVSIGAPFSFIERIEIDREELYDDDKRL